MGQSKWKEKKKTLHFRGSPSNEYEGWLCPIVCALAISLDQKWWQTTLEIKVSCSQWKGSAWTHEGSRFSLKKWEGEGEGAKSWGLGEGIFGGFFPCSQCVPIMFPWSSQKVPQFIPQDKLGGGFYWFFHFPWFPICSHYIPYKFPMGSSTCSW